MEYGCIARKLGHSFSAEIHALIGGYDYQLREVPENELDVFMKESKFSGINVTIPYKKDVIPYLFEINDIARRIGSVNTVVNRSGKLYGYNTDYFGLKALLEHNKIELFGRTVLILGTGGTSVTAQVLAADMGAEKVVVISRKQGDGVVNYAAAEQRYSHAHVIINTTPCGMYPDNYCEQNPLPLDLSEFSHLEALVDAVYNPLRPAYVRRAQELGVKATGGLYMLVAQACFASEIFRDTKIQTSKIDRIYDELLLTKTNIVLTGMPACGKSTIGRLIANELGREFVDSDAEIVNRTGKEITEIFSEVGEDGFRDIETEVIKDISKRNGIVLATGGGAVLRDENLSALKSNGKVFFLDRPLEWLKPTSDRPTASDKLALRKRYEERHDRYISTADEVIKPTDDAVLNAHLIIERFRK